MKAIKMFGLAALAALMAMAFVGASSAMAEPAVLCSADETTCSGEHSVTHVHETSVGNAKLLTSIGTTECTVLFLGDTSNWSEAGASLIISGTFTYSNCTLGGSSCTAKEENGPSEIKALKEGHETTKVTGEGLVHLVCGTSIDCSYNGTGLVGTGKGPLLSAQTPDNGEVTTNEASTTKETGGFLCPKTSKLDITTTPLTATYITAGLHYCVDYGKSNGYYQTEGCGEKTEEQNKLYELVVGPSGGILNAEKCVSKGALNGLYQNSVCSSDSAGSRYEIGKIKTIQ